MRNRAVIADMQRGRAATVKRRLQAAANLGKGYAVNPELGIRLIRQGPGQNLQPQNETHFFHPGNPAFTLTRHDRDC
ncbi:hypothetical protein [Bosea sp. Root381]|uniref:hypothetical protein n=1 Tax=Bosea sp. Root381 TaxID=1736524 RepID=UPI0012E3C63A|nr:hypothetical protein [Bosea sp. Root381]